MTQEQRDWGKLISIIIVTLVLLIGALSGCKEDEFPIPPDCLGEPNKDLVCTMEIDYVCGCNGFLYANECWAIRDGNTSWTAATVETNCKQ